MAEAGPLLGRTLELLVGDPAHGGSCVARHPDGPGGRVVFVRHALPGERVRALVTEDRGGSYCLADAIEVLTASPARVVPPCPHAGPGRCGGCDWQHVGADEQLALKTAVVRDQFARLAGLPLDGLFTGVEALPGGLLGWRTRTLYAVGPDGRPGLRRHRSHEVEVVERCPLGVAGVGDSAALDGLHPGLSGVEVVVGDGQEPAWLAHQPSSRTRRGRGRRLPDRVSLARGPDRVRQHVGSRPFEVDVRGFWQVHPAAATTFAEVVLSFVAPSPGESVLELYSGAGALTAPLAAAVGTTGRVVSIEADRQAVQDARDNLSDLAWVEPGCARVSAVTVAQVGIAPDVVVLDPPRSGAGRDVLTALFGLRPRCICYVACDPAALARDVATAVGSGWELRALRAFDAFPMTHHVECIALLEPVLAPPS